MALRRTGDRSSVVDIASVGLWHGIEENDDGTDDDADQPGRLRERHESPREELIVERLR
jgi:hypothetical protein